jgi:hypothetical protein
MADGTCSEMISVQVSKRTLSDKKEIVCEWCKKMKVELNEVKLEQGSCWECYRRKFAKLGHPYNLTLQRGGI